MTRKDIIRAWKDPEYRNNLNKEQLAQLPGNPAGAIELTDAEMERAAGGGGILLTIRGGVVLTIIPTLSC
jgi:mersacidin/lichenicidin family type 2 lantibiotic